MNSGTAGFTVLTRRIRLQPPAPAANATNMCGNSQIPCDERRSSLCVELLVVMMLVMMMLVVSLASKDVLFCALSNPLLVWGMGGGRRRGGVFFGFSTYQHTSSHFILSALP